MLDIVSEMNNKALQLPKTGEIQASMVLELMIALYNAQPPELSSHFEGRSMALFVCKPWWSILKGGAIWARCLHLRRV